MIVRYADLMAEARAEYARDFRALGRRVARHTRFGVHYGRTLDYDPWCVRCGRATKAKGYCLTHYVIEWRNAKRRARGLKYIRGQRNTTCGHLDRVHHAHGRCNSCDHIWQRDGGKHQDHKVTP